MQDGLFRSNLASDDTADLLRTAELDQKADSVEVVKAKYIVGAGGAHSWVRRELGLQTIFGGARHGANHGFAERPRQNYHLVYCFTPTKVETPYGHEAPTSIQTRELEMVAVRTLLNP